MAGGWIQLYNSEYFDFENTTYHNISIETIAHALSMQCRYNGHCNRFYSVGEHSVLVSNRVDELSGGNKFAALYGLLHDVSEAVLCDIPRPLKLMDGMEWYRKEEDNIQHNLLVRFIGNVNFSSARKFTGQADSEMLSTEKEQLMSESPLEWGNLPEPLDYNIACLSPEKAKLQFLTLYYSLRNEVIVERV